MAAVIYLTLRMLGPKVPLPQGRFTIPILFPLQE
jgi:hypothetical protein